MATTTPTVTGSSARHVIPRNVVSSVLVSRITSRRGDLHQERDLRLRRRAGRGPFLGGGPRWRAGRRVDVGEGVRRGTRLGRAEPVVPTGAGAADEQESAAFRSPGARSGGRRGAPVDGDRRDRGAGRR